ncbi:presqualene diphosphate synthase HpnD [Streptacidiphilus sp. PB12-B1b]|uniref:presqualene diphosphate synthase HpnD n=1 Tax=Streptacidiphilus sp. PB12-B1b TaxID=2705012 RepID=UPI0015FB4504|nr:presqualene diphosphate synthase HpnD [Streptacidiphilus sp. PB12-B1b]QMU76464.1 presqualene diphosphate synthase HpnD [Streptacidiphilus sp. PB12-B1b]
MEGISRVSPQVIAAYTYCEAVTGAQARNFSYGIRLLPQAKRRAMSAIYALARRIDDIGDGDWPLERKAEHLGRTRALLDEIREGSVEAEDTDPVKVALAHSAALFPIPLDAFDELIDGVEMDVRGTEYQTFEQLRVYCRCVAGTVGRLSLGVFGCSDPKRGAEYADTLGLGLQLTNILRDVREDAANGRTYLPAEDLARFGCEQGFADARPGASGGDFRGLVLFEAERAQAAFDEGLLLLPMLDRRSRACVAAMSGIYHRLLERIAAEPEAVLRGRMSLPAWEKAYVALSGLAGGRAS